MHWTPRHTRSGSASRANTGGPAGAVPGLSWVGYCSCRGAASAIEGLKAQVTANQKLVSQVGGAVQRIEKRTEERVEKAVEQVAGEASATMTASLDASNARAERIIAATAKLEARQLWSAAAATTGH